ncbi:MAG: biopolymer transporter ExbD [Deltaproteobacteria bacterium]|nr:biopolymer transporter ExbD [Deltaproteobacteria bacterium]
MSYEQQPPNQPPPEVEQGIQLDAAYLAKKKQKKGHSDLPPVGLAITSLMDAMTIILSFLMSNYAMEPISINQNDKLQVAFSSSKLEIQGAARVEIQADAIYCNQQRSALLREENGVRTVDEKAKAGGKSSYLIEDLRAQLDAYKQQLGEVERRTGRAYSTKDWLLIVADIHTPVRIIKEVLYTAKEAGYQRYMFAIVRTVTAMKD